MERAVLPVGESVASRLIHHPPGLAA